MPYAHKIVANATGRRRGDLHPRQLMTRSPVRTLPTAALAAAGRLVTVPLATRRTFGTRTALAPDAAAVGSVVAIGCQRLAARIPNAGVVAGGHSASRPSGRR